MLRCLHSQDPLLDHDSVLPLDCLGSVSWGKWTRLQVLRRGQQAKYMTCGGGLGHPEAAQTEGKTSLVSTNKKYLGDISLLELVVVEDYNPLPQPNGLYVCEATLCAVMLRKAICQLVP